MPVDELKQETREPPELILLLVHYPVSCLKRTAGAWEHQCLAAKNPHYDRICFAYSSVQHRRYVYCPARKRWEGEPFDMWGVKHSGR